MKRAFLLCTLLAAAPLTAFAQGTASAPLAGKLLITGSSTMAPMVEALAKRFRARHPGVVITVEAGGSGRGVADALAGKADIGMASRELAPKEKALFAIPIARDGVAFVVHKGNPVEALTRAQALSVFTGGITDWKALGGRSAPIVVAMRTPGAGVMEIVPHYLGIAPEAIRAEHAIGPNADVLRFIVANRNAIAFFSVGAADDAAQKVAPVKPLALDGVMPGIGSVRDGTWPLSRPLNLVTRRVAFVQMMQIVEGHRHKLIQIRRWYEGRSEFADRRCLNRFSAAHDLAYHVDKSFAVSQAQRVGFGKRFLDRHVALT